MKKIYVIFAAAALVGMTSCSSDLLTEEPVVNETQANAIAFENVLTNNSTRTSITGTNFKAGSAMEVYGFQTTNGEVDQIFDDQKVNYNGGTKWSYSPIKYWNPQSSYKFYAAYPEGNYAFDTTSRNFKITDFTVENAIADQVDLMIAEENSTTPGNTVTLNFNHILSQVNFYAKISSNMVGVASGKINNLKVTGLKNMGTFQQAGFDASTQNVLGEWTSTNGSYVFPAVGATPVAYTFVSAGEMTKDNGNVVRDLLMVPQPLTAVLFVDYTLTYNDGTTTRFTKEIPLESIKFNNAPVTAWQKNTIYNYIMTLDPSRVGKTDYTDVAIDPDGSINGDGEETPGTGIVGPDADGNYSVDVDGDGIGDYPIVWEDIDGDGKEEGGIDRDGDGHIDNVDGDTDTNTSTNPEVTDGDPTNNPDGKDVILVDTDGDGKPDTQLEKDTVVVVGPENPTQYTGIDYDGTLNGDGTPTPDTRLTQDADGNYYIEVDADGDGVYETSYPVLWADLDGDGKEEGYIGNIDGENDNPTGNPLVTDGDSNNPNGYDVILIDTDGDGVCDTQLEREKKDVVGPDPQVSNAIVFSAQVEEWETTKQPEVDITK